MIAIHIICIICCGRHFFGSIFLPFDVFFRILIRSQRRTVNLLVVLKIDPQSFSLLLLLIESNSIHWFVDYYTWLLNLWFRLSSWLVHRIAQDLMITKLLRNPAWLMFLGFYFSISIWICFSMLIYLWLRHEIWRLARLLFFENGWLNMRMVFVRHIHLLYWSHQFTFVGHWSSQRIQMASIHSWLIVWLINLNIISLCWLSLHFIDGIQLVKTYLPWFDSWMFDLDVILDELSWVLWLSSVTFVVLAIKVSVEASKFLRTPA